MWLRLCGRLSWKSAAEPRHLPLSVQGKSTVMSSAGQEVQLQHLQLLQVALQKAQTGLPDWVLLQPPGVSVHPQLHEARVELSQRPAEEQDCRCCHFIALDLNIFSLNTREHAMRVSLDKRAGLEVHIFTWRSFNNTKLFQKRQGGSDSFTLERKDHQKAINPVKRGNEQIVDSLGL